MTPQERSAYDNYTAWYKQLLAMGQALAEVIPLDELITVNTRATLTGTFRGPNGPEIVDHDRMGRQLRFLQAWQQFRDSLAQERIQVVPAGTVPMAGPPAPGR
jgi:hypothetical protein